MSSFAGRYRGPVEATRAFNMECRMFEVPPDEQNIDPPPYLTEYLAIADRRLNMAVSNTN